MQFSFFARNKFKNFLSKRNLKDGNRRRKKLFAKRRFFCFAPADDAAENCCDTVKPSSSTPFSPVKKYYERRGDCLRRPGFTNSCLGLFDLSVLKWKSRVVKKDRRKLLERIQKGDGKSVIPSGDIDQSLEKGKTENGKCVRIRSDDSGTLSSFSSSNVTAVLIGTNQPESRPRRPENRDGWKGVDGTRICRCVVIVILLFLVTGSKLCAITGTTFFMVIASHRDDLSRLDFVSLKKIPMEGLIRRNINGR